jgi:RimJ/RimL family protein N-acetyltransferase
VFVEPAEITAGPIHLRPPRTADIPELVAACADPEITRWTSVPHPYTEADAADYVSSSDAGWRSGRLACFCVLDSTSAALLGTTSLRLGEPGGAEVGYWVAAPARRTGVGRRAVAATCRWGFGALELERITWRAAVGNAASRALAERVGFTVEGTLRRGLDSKAGRVDCWIGSLLPGDRIG